MPVGFALPGVRELQQAGFLEGSRSELHADRTAVRCEAAGNAHAGETRERSRNRVKVAEVGGHRVALLAEVIGDARGHRGDDRVNRRESRTEFVSNQAADLLGLQVISVVVAMRQHIGADHDAALRRDLRCGCGG